ncbi:MAG: hypothetical protein R3B13_13640 [Polyangiaceae bacterium]
MRRRNMPWGHLPHAGWLAANLVAPAAAAQDCKPAVQVEGAEPLAGQVRQLLKESAAISGAKAGCAAARVTVTLEDDLVHVVLRNAVDQVQERRVSSAATAATLIESWLTTNAPVVEARREHTVETAHADINPTPPERSVTRDGPTPTQASPPSSAVAPARAGFMLESSVGNDGSLWGAATLSGCIRLGPVCAGGLIRGAEDTRVNGDAPRYDSERLSADVLLTVALPLSEEGIVVSPGIGAGLDWVYIQSRLPSRTEPGAVVDDDTGSPAVEAFLNVMLPIAQGLAFDGRLALQAAPLTHTEAFLDEGVTVSGAPWARAMVGFGLSYGAP